VLTDNVANREKPSSPQGDATHGDRPVSRRAAAGTFWRITEVRADPRVEKNEAARLKRLTLEVSIVLALLGVAEFFVRG
jgi:hypothetical protein